MPLKWDSVKLWMKNYFRVAIVPVSYTHLDVYKRQVLNRPNAPWLSAAWLNKTPKGLDLMTSNSAALSVTSKALGIYILKSVVISNCCELIAFSLTRFHFQLQALSEKVITIYAV